MADSRIYLPAGHRTDAALGVIYKCAPEGADDLTRISGIDTQTAARLNSLGIYCFGQIARWTPVQSTAVCEAMRIQAVRIEQEDWIAQARTLSPTRSVMSPASSAEFIRLISFAVLSVVAGIVVVIMLQNRGSDSLPGILSAETSGVSASEDIVLQESHVTIGQNVRRGQTLFTVERQTLQEQIAHEKATLEKIDGELRQAQARARLDLEWRLRDLNRELRNLQHNIPADTETNTSVNADRPATHRTAMLTSDARRTDSRLRTVARAGVALKSEPPSTHREPSVRRSGTIIFFSGETGEKGTIEIDSRPNDRADDPKPTIQVPEPKDATSQPIMIAANASQALAAVISKDIETLTKHRTFLPSDTTTASGVEQLQIQREKVVARLGELEEAAQCLELQAPAWGIIAEISVKEGERVRKGTQLLKLVHHERRFIVVDVSSRRIHELKEGDTVGLSFPGAESFEGIVASIPLLTTVVDQTGQSIVKVRIEPKGKLWPSVPIGTAIDVTIRCH